MRGGYLELRICRKTKRIINTVKIGVQDIKQSGKMDMERPINFDGEYFCIETDSDLNDGLYCFREDPLQDCYVKIEESLDFNTGVDPTSNIIDRIKLSANLANTPMTDLIEIAQGDYEWNPTNGDQLRRILWKSKMIEKRERARARKFCKQELKTVEKMAVEVISVPRGEDIKKQKNRLSAQISRDRKKQHYLKLEKENEDLKKSLSDLTKINAELQKKQPREVDEQKKKGDGFFKTLLILLGIIFLMNLIKGGNSEREAQKMQISKIDLSKQEKNFVTTELKAFGIDFNLEKEQNDYLINKNLGNKVLEIKASLF